VLPTFAVLSVINLYSAYMSAAVIDETFLNNNRSTLIFNKYFEHKENPEVEFKADVHSINLAETFYYPNFINFQRCKYIRFGDHPLFDTLTSNDNRYHAQSLML